MLEVNPAFTAAADLHFAAALTRHSREQRVALAVHAGGCVDETAERCSLHIPLSHPLEAWGDLRGHDGTASIVQPLIEPLYASKSAVEILAALIALGSENGVSPPTASAAGAPRLHRHRSRLQIYFPAATITSAKPGWRSGAIFPPQIGRCAGENPCVMA